MNRTDQAAMTLAEIGEAQSVMELIDAVCAAVLAGNPAPVVARKACVPVETVAAWMQERQGSWFIRSLRGETPGT